MRPRDIHGRFRRASVVAPVAYCLLAGAAPAVAQTSVAFNARLSETVTDNVGADASGGETRFVTSVGAGVNAQAKGAYTSASARFQGTSTFYHNDSDRDNSFVTGGAQAHSELVRDVAFLDVGGSIRRTVQSLFAPGSIDDVLDTGNRATLKTYFAMPSMRFRIGSRVNGGASYRWNWSSGGGLVEGTRLNETGAVNLGGDLSSKIGWSLGHTVSRTDTNVSRGAAESKHSQASLRFTYSRQLAFRLFGGYEENNYRDGLEQSYYTRGAGLDWVLSPRTNFSASVQKRFFGTGYNYSLAYGRPLSSFQLNYSRDVSSLESVSLLTLEEIAFRDFFISLTSAIPDPAEREEVARVLAGSIPNGSTSFIPVLSERFAVTRRLAASAAFVGARNSVAMGLSRSDSERIGGPVGLSANDPLATFSRLISSSAALSWSHTMGGKSSLSVALTYVDSEGMGETTTSARRNAVTCSYSTRLGPRTGATLSIRRQRSTGSSDFTEHALVGSIRTSF